MNEIKEHLRSYHIPFWQAEHFRTLKLQLTDRDRENRQLMLGLVGYTLQEHLPPSPHLSLIKALTLAFPGIALMILMLLGISLSWGLLLAIGSTSFFLILATSYSWISELGSNLIKGRLSTNGFFAFCTLLVWSLSMISLLFPGSVSFLVAFDMALILPAIRHVGLWIKALAYKQTKQPWQWHEHLRQSYPKIPPNNTSYKAHIGFVPVDSKALSDCIVNLKHLNGQDQNRLVRKGETILQGALLRSPTLLQATASFEESQIMAISKPSLFSEQSSLEQELSLWLNRYLWLVILFAIATAVVWILLNPAIALFSSLSVLLISCPCSLAMGVEMITKTTQSAALKHGVVFKTLDAVMNLAKSTTLWCDQTGTLTEPHVVAWTALETTQALLFRLERAILAHDSNNPYALALLKLAPQTNDHHDENIKVISTSGGIILEEQQDRYYLGSAHFIKQHHTHLDLDLELAHCHLVNAEGEHLAKIKFEDQVKDQTFGSITMLGTLFKDVNLITGNDTISLSSSFEQTINNALPKEKVEALQATPNATFLGDGLNDYPAQIEALCGVSYRQDLDGIDITLARNDPWGLVVAKTMANQCRKAVQFLLGFSVVYNIAAITLAAGGFFLLTGTALSPMIAALMMLGSFLVIPFTSLILSYIHHTEIPTMDTSSTYSLPTDYDDTSSLFNKKGLDDSLWDKPEAQITPYTPQRDTSQTLSLSDVDKSPIPFSFD